MNKKELVDEVVIPYQNAVLRKSNKLIGMKYQASTLENQITYLAMLKIQHKEREIKPDGIYVNIKAAEIKKEIGTDSGSFYQRLKEVANEMTGNNYGIVDDEHEKFEFVTLINKASYEDGVFSIRFASEMKDNLINIGIYTPLPKKIVMELKKRYSFPLYQLLKSQCYYPSDYKGRRDYVFLVSIGLSELKLEMGVVNINAFPSVKNALLNGTGRTEDYDAAVAKSPDQKFKTWSSFELQCLRPTVEEINDKSDIYVEYKPKRSGRGGKIYAVDFTVWLNGADKSKTVNSVYIDNNGNLKTNLSEIEKFMFYSEGAALFKEYGLTPEDAIKLAEETNFNMDVLYKTKELLDKQKNIENVMGWIITCIREEFYKNAKNIENKDTKSPKNKFNDISSREYDFDELEKQLIQNS